MPEHTIAENLQRLQTAKTAIGNAITAKGGTVGANDGLEDFASDIATIPSGGGSATRKDVNFYDYDGTIVNSYTAAEFANLSAMPSNPSHDGLTAQGWNWTLSDAKTYVASYGKLEIGQMYITSDGKTRLYITLTEGRTSPILQLYLNENSELDIDWGDGSAHSTFTSTSADFVSERHNYTNVADYIITIEVTDGSFDLRSSASSSSINSILWNGDNSPNSPDIAYNISIKRIELGTNVDIQNGCLRLSALVSITIPNSVANLNNGAFNACKSLVSITIPNSVTTIGTTVFSGCSSLTSISIPNSVTTIGSSAFYGCSSLTSISIPNSY